MRVIGAIGFTASIASLILLSPYPRQSQFRIALTITLEESREEREGLMTYSGHIRQRTELLSTTSWSVWRCTNIIYLVFVHYLIVIVALA